MVSPCLWCGTSTPPPAIAFFDGTGALNLHAGCATEMLKQLKKMILATKEEFQPKEAQK